MDILIEEAMQQLDKIPEQIRTCKQIQIERCRSENDRVGQTEEWGGQHPGYRVQATHTVISHTYHGVRKQHAAITNTT